AKLLGLGRRGEARRPAQQARRIDYVVEEPRCMTKERRFLLQIDVDAAEEDALLADVVLVGADRRVERDKQGVVPRSGQSGRQGVVVHATAAEHAGGTGGNVGDFHGSILKRNRQSQKCSAGWHASAVLERRSRRPI